MPMIVAVLVKAPPPCPFMSTAVGRECGFCVAIILIRDDEIRRAAPPARAITVWRAPDERSKLSSSNQKLMLLLRLLQLLLIATAAAFAPVAPQGRCSVQLTSYKALHAAPVDSSDAVTAAAESLVGDAPVKKQGSVIAAAALVAGTTIGGTAQHSYF
jgi:hypothetical protein